MVFIYVISTNLADIDFSTSECCFTSKGFWYLPNSKYLIGTSLNRKEAIFEGIVETM